MAYLDFTEDKKRVLEENYEKMKALSAENSSLQSRINRTKILTQKTQSDVTEFKDTCLKNLHSDRSKTKEYRLKYADVLMKQRLLHYCCLINGFQNASNALVIDDGALPLDNKTYNNDLDDIDMAIKVF